MLVFLKGVAGWYGVQSVGEDGEVEGKRGGEEVEGVEGAADVEELEAREEDYADVLGGWGRHVGG